MRRSLLFQVFGLFILLNLVLSPLAVLPDAANSPLSQPAAAGKVDLSLAELGMEGPQTLPGPISSMAVRFNLPVAWKPSGTATLDLDLSAFFSSLVPTENTASISGLVGGNFSVFLNNNLLQVKTLQKSGEQVLHLEFNANLLSLPARGGFNELRLQWDGSVSCQMNLLSSVTVIPTSRLGIAYTEEPKALTLNDYPVPFLMDYAIRPVSLAVVLPDAPSLSEVRAGLIIAAGLGQAARNTAPIDLVKASDYLNLNPRPNLILAASQDHLAGLNAAALGLPSKARSEAGEGTLQFFKHSSGAYGILVSGDESGLVEAAQVLSARQIVAGGDASTMIVSGVNPVPSAYGKEDMTLEELGVGEMLFNYQRGLDQKFDFYMPAGEQARADSSFNLILSHSQQIDYLRSGLQVKLNGYPAISLRLMDTNSNQTVFTMILPANLMHPGRNTIELVADLQTRDLCTPPSESIAWLRVSATSTLHIPLERAVASAVTPKTFKDFPDAFLSGTGLDNVSFILSPGDFNIFKAAGKLAYLLGAALPQNQPIQLRAALSNAVDPAVTKDANLLLVGKPLDFGALNTREYFPSLAFNPDNTLSPASTLTVVAKPVASTDVGYLAIRGYDSQSSRVLLAVLGNNPTAVATSVETLSAASVGSSNFAYVAGPGAQTGWLDKGIATGEIASSSAQATPAPSAGSTSQQFKLGMLIWALPLTIALAVLLVFFAYFEVRQMFTKE